MVLIVCLSSLVRGCTRLYECPRDKRYDIVVVTTKRQPQGPWGGPGVPSCGFQTHTAYLAAGMVRWPISRPAPAASGVSKGKVQIFPGQCYSPLAYIGASITSSIICLNISLTPKQLEFMQATNCIAHNARTHHHDCEISGVTPTRKLIQNQHNRWVCRDTLAVLSVEFLPNWSEQPCTSNTRAWVMPWRLSC